MTVISITKKEINYILSLAKKRHDAKPSNIKNSGILIDRDLNNPLENYLPHFIGIVGEYAWAKHTNKNIDETIYEIRDDEDFNGEEVKTITYYGTGESELKVKVQEYNNKKPLKYILARTNKDNILKALNSDSQKTLKVELLGEICRSDFEREKIKKRYGQYNPENYVVPLSKMKEL